MKPVREKATIQIEVTNHCINQCANCSRFVGHHPAPYFMDLELVEKSICSVADFPGFVGIIGGEPTLHPDFPEICRLMKELLPPHKRYLWTGGHNWKRYEKLIHKSFGPNVVFNNHNDATQKHHPMLLCISDMIDDPEYVQQLVRNCWVDERWSASINPKGCFFCEIAAAMDMLFDGPGGLPIEKGWWKKGPEAFMDQRLRYCFGCGANVPFFPQTLENQQDLVSQSSYERLEKMGSPKLKRGGVKLVSKMSAQDLASYAKEWQPWDHLGVKGNKGTGNSDYELYAPMRRWVLRIKRAMRNRSRLYRWIELHAAKLGWRLGIR